jgi:hypothetical protein
MQEAESVTPQSMAALALRSGWDDRSGDRTATIPTTIAATVAAATTTAVR